jgi:nucleotide-binding universal stress UspA family protein
MAKIVVGVDGSERSKDALRWGVEEARLRHVPVLAIYAWEPPELVPEISPTPMAPSGFDPLVALPELQDAAARLVEGAIEEVGAADVEVTGEEREGPAGHVLVDAVDAGDLLVVGSRGQGALATLVLGSVSQHCAQHAPCPVVIFRRPDAD